MKSFINKKHTTILSVIIAIIIMIGMETIECSGNSNFCMPPLSTFKQDVYYMSTRIRNGSPNIVSFTYQSTVQINVLEGKKRVDTIDSSGILNSEIIFIDYNNQNITHVYTIEEGSCSCLNIGQPTSDILEQCITMNVIEKDTIANLQCLKVGENNTTPNSQIANSSIYWIAPTTSSSSSSSSPYWWIVSHTEYNNDGQDNIDMTSTSYYNHQNSINQKNFILPSNCPPMDKCPHPR